MLLGCGSAAAALPPGGLPLAGRELALLTAVCWLPALADVLAQVASRHAYRSHRLTRLLTGLALGAGILPASQLVRAWLG
jgi:hypothetical protein